MNDERREKIEEIATRAGEDHYGLKFAIYSVIEVCKDGKMKDYLDGFTHGLYMADIISMEECQFIRNVCEPIIGVKYEEAF